MYSSSKGKKVFATYAATQHFFNIGSSMQRLVTHRRRDYSSGDLAGRKMITARNGGVYGGAARDFRRKPTDSRP
jgi:hypothetical protein